MNAERTAIPFSTDAGVFLAHYSARGLTALDFPNRNRSRRTGPASKSLPPLVSRWHRLTVRALTDALTGKPMAELPPLDLSAGTVFQKQVWGALREIAWGKTATYSQVAAAIGKPGAARAVGSACGANPIPVLIPCHRVLGANGQLGGFSAGLKWKRLLLAREDVRLDIRSE